MFTILGKTTEGRTVVGGVYRAFETHGIPLDLLLEQLHQKGLVPSWTDFYVEALSAGMKHERILSKLEPALCDVYGRDFKNTVIGRLNALKGGGHG